LSKPSDADTLKTSEDPQTNLDSSEKKEDDDNLQPLMYLAGLYDVWVNKETNEKIRSVTILTTSAAQDIGWIHDRMPVILVGDAVLKWLDVKTYNFEQCRSALLPYKGLKSYAVSDSVSNIRNHGPECIEPMEKAIERQKKAGIQKFFLPTKSTPKGSSAPSTTKTKTETDCVPHKTNPPVQSVLNQSHADDSGAPDGCTSKKPTAASRKRKSPPPPS